MRKGKSFFNFNKQERSGIFFLLVIIVVLQGTYWFMRTASSENSKPGILVEPHVQAKIDSLKQIQGSKSTIKIFPFNPNFISDYKGYTLGMTVDEIDRLHRFRAQDKFITSALEFHKITLISDSLFQEISPFFKFPDWTQKEKKPLLEKNNIPDVVKDLNAVTAEELKSISGIGDVLSVRIVKFRDRLGGFLVDDQLYDVYGLEVIVAQKTLKKYRVQTVPVIKKININIASEDEIASLVYIGYALARKIVMYRQANGGIDSFNELKKIEGFPSDKIHRIELYLSL